MTYYELFNLSSGNRIGEFDTEEAALADVRAVVERRGARAIDGIGLLEQYDDGRSKLLAGGQALADRATTPVPA